MHELGETAKHIIDALSVVAVVTTILGWLPPIAALLGIIWYCVLFYDRFVLKRKPTPEQL